MDRVALPEDPLSRFSRQIFTINGLLLKAGTIVAQSSGTTVAKWHVLARANYKPRTVSEIARYLGLSRQAVQQTSDSLVRDGHLCCIDNPLDRRAQLVAITEAGAKVLSSLYATDAVWSANLAKQLEGHHLDHVIAQLEPLISVLSEYLGGSHDRS